MLYGLFYTLNAQPVALSLLSVEARCTIKDLAASVSLSQVYHNESTVAVEGSYKFPVPARAAVCSFELVKQDGTKVVGVVQEKEEARQTYDHAVQEGKVASLMEQDTPDTFSVTVGNLLPNEQVTVNLTYVTELTESDTNDSIRLHVPAHIGARYGQPPASKPPASLLSLSANSSSTFFSLRTSIESVAPIKSISCPSHSVTTSLGPDSSLPNAAASLPFSNYAQITFTSDVTLDKDFVLSIESAGLDAPRCIAEIHPSHATAALSLSMVPRFSLPEIKEQEYIFLVDRSGSMDGDRIDMAQKALVVLLRSLPKEGSHFNVVSFGSSHKPLWKKTSRLYSQATLNEATRHVDSMQADFGGTEMRSALEGTFALRHQSKVTSVFVLTDGDAWDLEGVNAIVESAVAASSTSAPLRVFVLGIGSSASTAMCEGIARLGNGVAQFVVDGESFTGKTARLLKAARTPQLVNIRLELPKSTPPPRYMTEEDFELVEEPEKLTAGQFAVETFAPTVSLFDDAVNPLATTDTSFPALAPIILPPPRSVQQAPAEIANLFPGSRLHAYLLLTPASLLPTTLILRAEVASTGKELSLEVPVTLSGLSSGDSSTLSAIHILAARKLIQDLEDGRHSLDIKHDDELLEQTVKAHIVRLGKAYSLASTHTSFVAVDESDVASRRHEIRKTRLPLPPPFEDYGSLRLMSTLAAPSGGFGGGGGATTLRSRSAAAPKMFLARKCAAPAIPPPPMPCLPALMCSPVAVGYGMAPSSSSPPGRRVSRGSSEGSACGGPSSAEATSDEYAKEFSSSIDNGIVDSYSSTMVAPVKKRKGSSPFAWFSRSSSSPSPPLSTSTAETSVSPPPPRTPSDIIEALARLQSFEGSFSTSAISLCGVSLSLVDLLAKVPELKGDQEAGSTLLVLAYWEKDLVAQKEEWEGMAEKAREFIATRIKVEDKVVDLITRVQQLI